MEKTALALAGELNETRIRLTAYRRLTHALGAELGLKPGEVDRAIGMAKAGVKEDLQFEEVKPGMHVGDSVENLIDESAEAATKKGRQYVDEVMKEY